MHNAFFQISSFVQIHIYTYIFSPPYIRLHHSIFISLCRFPNNKHENNQVNNQGVDFKRVMYTDEFGSDEDTEEDILPSDLKRLVEAKERQILPHQETTENVKFMLHYSHSCTKTEFANFFDRF